MNATDLETILNSFYCNKDYEIVSFLKNNAVLFESIGKSRTYFIVDEISASKQPQILAYFSLAMQNMPLSNTISNSKIRFINGLGYKNSDGTRISNLPVFLIGQLAKNDIYADKIKGYEILQKALLLIKEAQKIVGGRIVLVDCKPIDKLHKFYECNGFSYIGTNEITHLDQMVLKII